MPVVITIFAILTIAGAWTGWRRSPLYSEKITLRLIGVFILTAGAIAGGSLAIFAAARASPTAQAILLGILVIVVGAAATAGIIRITDSHVAKLPPSTRMVTIERHKVQRWIWRIAAYVAISVAATLAIPTNSAAIPAVSCILLLLGGGPALVALYMRARRLDLGMSQVLSAPWAYWRYTSEQWQDWADDQLAWERSKQTKVDWRREWPGAIKATAMLAALFVGCSFLMVSGSANEKLIAAAAGMGFCGVLVFVWWLINLGASERHYKRLLAAPREVVFGDEGLYSNGQFTPWILSGAYLTEATSPLDSSPHLTFMFRTFNGSDSSLVARRVPIPPGRERDIAVIQRKLSVCCPKADVRLA